MEIVIDFDGTVVSHEFPKIGKDINSVPVLKKLIDNGNKLILFTMRSDKYLEEAVKWFKENNIELYGIQTNPTQHTWTSSPKAYGQLIIDDAALGCPLTTNLEVSNRPYVDWKKVEELLIELNVIEL